MKLDPQTRAVLDEFARELASQRKEIAALRRAQRAPQLAHSSLEEGQALEVRDDTGATRMRFGYQPDGTVTTTVEGGDPPPAPSTPTVTAMASGLVVAWDGTLADTELALPADFDHVNVHVSTVDGFIPDATTFQVSIPRAGGSVPITPLTVGTTYYVILVPVGTGGVSGTASAQASGVPDAVTDIAPGSITETEIADDAISTPKLQAEAVTALKIAAEAIEAGHIQAAAVTASKLEADLVLGTRIIAGTPGGARVELDPTGLKGYDASDALVFAVDSAGNALFSGDITGSEITGSRMTIDSGTGNIGVIEDASGVVRVRATSASDARAQLAATDTQAEFSVWADETSATTPVGAMIAASGISQLVMYSDVSDPTTSPVVSLSALTDSTRLSARSGSGSEVEIESLTDYSRIRITAPDAIDPDDAQGAGYIFTQRYGSDIAAVSMQGPEWSDNTGPEYQRRSMFHLEGARPERAYTRATYSAQRHIVQGEWDGVADAIDATSDGVLELADTHSILADRHAPVRTDMVAEPTIDGDGSFHDFTAGQMPAVDFTTGWSGRVRVTIAMCGINNNTNASTISLGFRLSGSSTVAADLTRAAMIRSTGAGSATNSGRQQSAAVYLDLNGNADYTLTPVWRISGSTAWGADQKFDLNYQNAVIVEPLT
ncbi:hypothetical protein [Nocardiopsis sp. NRRL B-16309]|uniref:hypothetical protein n=1 Tax=Nocardiopsis sp. NRRL B-16309 TaxID=1519494 RepID=UPI0006AE7F68|nr:hypothetical protein [Nocardiopsis sp. NRRL B-16309]KOX10150.1 hypothetical protein ADL05_26100 [Nocardiopsis sp. NRRL B-16309]